MSFCLLSGGLSFYSTREGFICDNVINFEVVVASGEILNANCQKNPDLWAALRGGGNNLGMESISLDVVRSSSILSEDHIKA